MRFIPLEMQIFPPGKQHGFKYPGVDTAISKASIEQISEVMDLSRDQENVIETIGLNIFLTSGRIIFVHNASVGDLYLQSMDDDDVIIDRGAVKSISGIDGISAKELEIMTREGFDAYEVSAPITNLVHTGESLHDQLSRKYLNTHFAR